MQRCPPEGFLNCGAIVVPRSTSDGEPLFADPTFDIWSLGTMMYELASRQLLFNTNSDGSLKQFELQRLVNWSLGELANVIDLLRSVLRAVSDRTLVLSVVDLVS